VEGLAPGHLPHGSGVIKGFVIDHHGCAFGGLLGVVLGRL
jgi:hypothetical protein